METTALGAAYLAGRQVGFYGDLDVFAKNWNLQQRFEPRMEEGHRAAKYAGWKDAVVRVRSGD